MSAPADPQNAWPHPALASDDTLDMAGVMAATGCTKEDFDELALIFRQEQANMVQRLQRARQAMLEHREQPGWDLAVEQLRSAAHELTTSFGIVGARRAEAYARQTQLLTRRNSTSAAPPPTADDVLTAANALADSVDRVAEMLRRAG